MIVLAIDPGSRSGWATSDPELSGVVDHRRAAMEDWWGDKPQRGRHAAWTHTLDKDERLKRVLGVYVLWLEGLVRYCQPSLLILERQKPFRGYANTHVLEFRGATLGVAGRLDLAFAECAPEAWQQHLNGEEYNPAVDHDLAAKCMLLWWCAQQ